MEAHGLRSVAWPVVGTCSKSTDHDLKLLVLSYFSLGDDLMKTIHALYKLFAQSS